MEVPVASTRDDELTPALTLELPGYNASNLSIKVEGDVLSIEGESTRTGTRPAKLSKKYHLASTVDVASIQASCVDGVLHVYAPRATPPPPISVPVSSEMLPELPAADKEGTSSMEEEEAPYQWSMQVPGLSASDVEVTVAPGGRLLKITGKTLTKSSKGETTSESAFEFSRQVSLPRVVSDASLIEASCTDGILSVRVPRAALLDQRMRIPVSAEPSLPQLETTDLPGVEEALQDQKVDAQA